MITILIDFEEKPRKLHLKCEDQLNNKGFFNKTNGISYFLFFTPQYESIGSLQFLSQNPHNTPKIMRDRHKNLKDSTSNAIRQI